jgi:hypothetical protein
LGCRLGARCEALAVLLGKTNKKCTSRDLRRHIELLDLRLFQRPAVKELKVRRCFTDNPDLSWKYAGINLNWFLHIQEIMKKNNQE